jgi:hypothetical protein
MLMNYNDELLKFPDMVDMRKTLPRHATKTWKRRDPATIQGVVYHQSLEEIGSASGNAKYHVGPNHISDTGLPGLSYTLFVQRDNKIVLANDVEDITWSQGDATKVGDENAMYLSMCFGGNFSGTGYQGTQSPTAKQKETALSFWAYAKNLWMLNNKQLFGHYDFGKPACPGMELSAMIENINNKRDGNAPKFNTTSSLGRQEALRALGYLKGEADGVWGPESRAALVAFQRDKNLISDGVWGQNTANAVISALK